jgi:hypothetical protein
MERRPLVVVNGRVQELPLTDTLPAQGEEEMVYSKRTDFVGEDVIYRGEAVVGSSEGSSTWRIRKIFLDVDGDVTETWAGGTAAFDKAWNLRTTYVYS